MGWADSQACTGSWGCLPLSLSGNGLSNRTLLAQMFANSTVRVLLKAVSSLQTLSGSGSPSSCPGQQWKDGAEKHGGSGRAN